MANRNGNFRIDFTGIGIAKAGTTWLARCLAEHPQVCMATGKEPNYFIRQHPLADLPVQSFLGRSNHSEGIDWYCSRYDHWQKGQLRGEFSVAYFGGPETPQMLWEHNPRMKLIACFRNPVDAAYSGFHQLCRKQPIYDSLEAFAENHSELLDYFNYHQHTRRFLDVFPREQMLLLLFDDIREDAEGVFSEVCRFLEIDDAVRPASLHERVNSRVVVRSRRVRDLRSLLTGALAANGATRRIRRGLMQSGLGRPILKLFLLNEKAGAYAPMDPGMRARLSERFREENERLGELLGRDLSHWNEPVPQPREAVAT